MINTPRLLLRKPELADFDRWAEFMADPVATKYLGGVQQRPMAWRSMMCMAGAWQLTGVAMFSVIERSTGLWLGRIGPWQPEGWPGTEIGWGLHPDAWGKGYALEAATAAMDYAVDVLGWQQIIHTIDPENIASAQLAQRLGSNNLGPGKLPVPYDQVRVDVWGQSADEWRARRR